MTPSSAQILVITSFLLPLLTIIFFFLNHAKGKTPTKESKPLPFPPKLPLLGNFHQLGSLPHRTLRSFSDQYGPVMLIHFGQKPTIVVSSADAAEEVMKTKDINFASRPESYVAKGLLYNGSDVAFAPYGEYWRQLRRICVLHLLSIKRVQSFSRVREEEVAVLIKNISASASSVNLSDLVTRLTSDVVCRVAFGRRYMDEEGGAAKIQATLQEFSTLLGTLAFKDFTPWLGWIDRLRGLDRRVRNNSRELDEILEKVLGDHHRTKEEGVVRYEDGDFVDILLAVNEKDESLGVTLSRENMKAIVLDMFAGGTHTTSATIEWVMAELLKNPEEMKKVQNEVREIVGLNAKVEEHLLDEMKYLKAVIKETLRLHPPIPLLVPRETIKDTKLQGYDIPAKTRVVINAWAIGRDPKSYERGEEFWPERFVSSIIDFKGQNFQFIPFGAGRRGCPGVAFGMPVVELALANLLYHFDWKYSNVMDREFVDMCESSGLVAKLKSNLILAPKSFGC
ncbi:cytochrome P450 71A1-like [Typha angustifolia]|uniref:cytochrome P450 71A1-like n=1 Tax=Typha angustifolia TaxID=59011 RepID=UPI003C2E187F